MLGFLILQHERLIRDERVQRSEPDILCCRTWAGRSKIFFNSWRENAMGRERSEKYVFLFISLFFAGLFISLFLFSEKKRGEFFEM